MNLKPRGSFVFLFTVCGIVACFGPEFSSLRLTPAFGSRGSDAYTLEDVLAEISRRSGVTALADASAAKERVRWPALKSEVTAGNVEDYVASIVKSLPEGANFAKLYLPAPPSGKSLKGDDVVAFALAQARLYGTVGAIPPAGMVEVLSQRLPEEKAKAVIAALNLKPVYVVTLGPGTFAGVWETTFGEMRLRQAGRRVTGNYTFSDGVIEGTISGGVLRFQWLERDSGGKGTGKFALSEDGQSFTGRWGYEEDPDAGPSEWVGTRLSRNPNSPVHGTGQVNSGRLGTIFLTMPISAKLKE